MGDLTKAQRAALTLLQGRLWRAYLLPAHPRTVNVLLERKLAEITHVTSMRFIEITEAGRVALKDHPRP